MNKYFVDWYRVIDPEATDDKLNKRWNGIIYYSKRKKQLTKALNLIRLFYNLPILDDIFEEEYIEAFQKNDASISIREWKGSNELRVLAGANLVYLIENKNNPISTAIALAVVCCHVRGLRSDLPVPDLLSISSQQIIDQSIESRNRNELIFSDVRDFGLEKGVEDIRNFGKQNDSSNMSDSIAVSISTITTITKSNFENLLNSVKLQNQQIKLQQEETNILWWIFSETSRIKEQQFSEIKLPEASILAAKELENLVVSLPGPKAATDFLNRVLSRADGDITEKITIRDLISHLPNDIKAQVIAKTNNYFLDDICPLIYAIAKSLEIVDEDGWISAFEHCTKINASSSLLPIDLSNQFFQELITVKTFAQTEE